MKRLLNGLIKFASIRRTLPVLLKTAQAKTQYPITGTYTPDERVRAFFDEIIPYIKAHSTTAGVPGTDYNDSLYGAGLYSGLPIYTTNSDMGRGVGGRYYPEIYGNNPYIMVRNTPRTTVSEFVHELMHRLHRDGDKVQRKWLGGLSKADNDLLSNVWGFTKKDTPRAVPTHEQGATHGQHLFNIYNELWNQTKGKPTPEAFRDYIQNADRDTLIGWRQHIVNGYQQSADKRARDAWMSKWKDTFPQEGLSIKLDPESLKAVRESAWYKLNPNAFESAFGIKDGDKRTSVFIYPKDVYEKSMYSDDMLENFRNSLLNVAKNVVPSRLVTKSKNVV